MAVLFRAHLDGVTEVELPAAHRQGSMGSESARVHGAGLLRAQGSRLAEDAMIGREASLLGFWKIRDPFQAKLAM